MRFRSLWSRIHELERRLLPKEEVKIVVIPSVSGLSWEEHHRNMRKNKEDCLKAGEMWAGLEIPLPPNIAKRAREETAD